MASCDKLAANFLAFIQSIGLKKATPGKAIPCLVFPDKSYLRHGCYYQWCKRTAFGA
jgi:hypothetical protein